MRLTKDVFTFDIPAAVERLCRFIRAKRLDLCRNGILVPVSGGLDSSTVLLLCARAVGKDRVKALLLPERQGNPDAERFARLLAGRSGIEALTRDITPVLEKLDVYGFIQARLPLRPVVDLAARAYLRLVRGNPFLEIVHGATHPLKRRGFARINAKHRIRSVVTYLLAEEMNLLVAGCAHKTEGMLGLFVKFGVDDNADVMPLKNLYRTQILRLAAHLGVPDEILQRPPNPDIIPGVSDKYRDVLGLSSDILDLILYGIERNLTNTEIASRLRLPAKKIQEIRLLVENTRHMRNPSQSIHWT
jgi:NAD+ synthase